MHVPRAPNLLDPAKKAQKARKANKTVGLIGHGDGVKAGQRQRVLSALFRLAPYRKLEDSMLVPTNIESASTFSQNLLRRLPVTQWVTFDEQRWVNADERQGQVLKVIACTRRQHCVGEPRGRNL
jgi:hypothetical protein